MKNIRKYKSAAMKKHMNKAAITTIVTLSFCFNALAQEVKNTDWTEEEWKKDKGTYGWVFPHIDKNADGKVIAAEYEAFHNYKKKHPNWEIELKANAKPAGTKAPSEANVDDIPQGVEALEAALNKERMAQAVEMLEKLDKNKDGKITDKEVPPAQFKKQAWIQANVNGDMILTWEEELIWQYNYQKKKAGKSK